MIHLTLTIVCQTVLGALPSLDSFSSVDSDTQANPNPNPNPNPNHIPNSNPNPDLNSSPTPILPLLIRLTPYPQSHPYLWPHVS